MNNFFSAIGEMFEAIFPMLRATGPSMNIIFSLLIAVGTFIWIFGGSKYKEPKK
jgi:hypothetical protein